MTTSRPAHNRWGLIAAGTLAATAAVGYGAAAATGDGADHASATIIDTTGAEIGRATFTEDANGVMHVNVKIGGLTPGQHGIHVHGVGSCSPTFAAAGSHHNPLGAAHGAHSGDLPNMTVNAAGQGRLNAATTSATLSDGPVSVFDLDGAAIVIHADPDDFVTQPTGNSGARVACGVIGEG
jgi:Cu-Zn family superoxide dismutase